VIEGVPFKDGLRKDDSTRLHSNQKVA
jgi:hypothetical protein